jgi:hypothetical protein
MKEDVPARTPGASRHWVVTPSEVHPGHFLIREGEWRRAEVGKSILVRELTDDELAAELARPAERLREAEQKDPA